MRKGEIACNKQFLLFSQCFQPYMALIFHFKYFKMLSAIFFDLYQSKILSSGYGLTPSQTSPGFMCIYVQYKSFENTAGKGEIARNKQFLLFPTVFPTCFESSLPLSTKSKLSPSNSFNLEESKICHLETVNPLPDCKI